MPRRYQAAADRHQPSLLPMRLEDYVDPDHPVRGIDVLGGVFRPQAAGLSAHGRLQWGRTITRRPSHPAQAVSVWLSEPPAQLERELKRNVELIWLCQGSTPSYKTIADFRENNLEALTATHREFIRLCRELKLVSSQRVAVDGTYVKADVSKNHGYTVKQLKKSWEKIEQKLQEYYQ